MDIRLSSDTDAGPELRASRSGLEYVGEIGNLRAWPGIFAASANHDCFVRVGFCDHLNVCTRSPPASPRTCIPKVSVPGDCLGQVRSDHVEMSSFASLPLMLLITSQCLYIWLTDALTRPRLTMLPPAWPRVGITPEQNAQLLVYVLLYFFISQ